MPEGVFGVFGVRYRCIFFFFSFWKAVIRHRQVDHDDTGIWEELGPTRLAFLEYLLIGVAGLMSPHLLNREGIGRR